MQVQKQHASWKYKCDLSWCLLNSEHDAGFKSDSRICDLGKKHPLRKNMYLSALIQSGTTKRIVSFAVVPLGILSWKEHSVAIAAPTLGVFLCRYMSL